MRPYSRGDFPDFKFSHNFVTEQISGGTTETITEGDAIFDQFTAATYFRGGGIDVEGLIFGQGGIENLTPSVASIDQDGLITRLSSGILRVVVNNGSIKILCVVDLRDKDDELDQPKEFTSTVVGSLAEHFQKQIDDRIDSSMSMAANGLLYSTQDHSTPNYVRNPDLWCSDIDMTCISPWKSGGLMVDNTVTLITPRHAIGTTHFPLQPGRNVRYIEQDGTIHERTAVGLQKSNSSFLMGDLSIVVLDQDLPGSITPCRVMPADNEDYLVNNRDNRPPSIGLEQEEKATIQDWRGGGSHLKPTAADRLIFYEDKITGDSSDPAFLVLNGELVLTTVWTSGGAGGGTPVADNIQTINAAIASLDQAAGDITGYTVTEADFSAWPNFSTNNFLYGDDGTGNISAWVENGTLNGKQAYIQRNSGETLEWSGSAWEMKDGASVTDSSSGDVTTPDLATFTTYVFTSP